MALAPLPPPAEATGLRQKDDGGGVNKLEIGTSEKIWR
jgi:hypothetical protein